MAAPTRRCSRHDPQRLAGPVVVDPDEAIAIPAARNWRCHRRPEPSPNPSACISRHAQCCPSTSRLRAQRREARPPSGSLRHRSASGSDGSALQQAPRPTAPVASRRAVGQHHPTALRSRGSTNRPARKPGIDPVCPTSVPVACPAQPQPQAVGADMLVVRHRRRARSASRSHDSTLSSPARTPARTSGPASKIARRTPELAGRCHRCRCRAPARPAARRSPGCATSGRCAGPGWYVVAAQAQRNQQLRRSPPRTRCVTAAARRAGRAARSRGCCSGSARLRRKTRTSSAFGAASSGQSLPGVRSHHCPAGSAVIPDRCASRSRIVASAYGASGRWRPIRSLRSISPSSRSRITRTAVNVLVIEPIRYWRADVARRRADQINRPCVEQPRRAGWRVALRRRSRRRPAASLRRHRRSRRGQSSSVLGERRRVGALAHQVAVAVRLVDPADRRPVLVDRAARPETLPARASRPGPSRRGRQPSCAARARAGCRSSAISPLSTAAISARIAIIAVAEALDLGQRLRLGRLDHQRARAPGSSSSARGSRSRSAAWRRRRH